MSTTNKISIHEIFASYFKDNETRELAQAVSRKLEEGNICLDLDLYNNSVEDLKFDINKIIKSPYVSMDENKIRPFILKNNKVYLQRYFNYETTILNSISNLISTGESQKDEKYQSLIENKKLLFSLFDYQGDASEYILQMLAAINSFINGFSIITGGPGTGKTSTITKLLILLLTIEKNSKIALAAPTGKAAYRMTESIANASNKINGLNKEIQDELEKLEAQTIHRLLGVNYHNPHSFIHNKDNPLIYDVIIIDEASMIGSALMAKLLSAVKSGSKLIMLGDKNQLSSVEAGSIFGDLCKVNNNNTFSEKDIDFFNALLNITVPEDYLATTTNSLTGKIVELTKSYRFNDEEGIGKFSRLILSANDDFSKNLEDFRQCPPKGQCVKIINDYSNPLTEKILTLYEDYAAENDIELALEKLNNVKILCAVKEGKHGVAYYNSLIAKHLKLNNSNNNSFYDKQAIMISNNDYTLGLFNGDTGIIRKDKSSDKYYFYYKNEKNELQKIPAVNINHYITAFAMTIHKSQGSEYENIMIVLPENPEVKILTKELIYTAVTRSSSKVVILTSNTTLIESVNKSTNKISGIKERIIS